MRILIVEDDKKVAAFLQKGLREEQYAVDVCRNGNDAGYEAQTHPYDVIILDIMLPGLNGYEICRKIKQEKPDLPVIMLTARGSEMDMVSGLDTGADDYITKPFSLPELLARIRASFRRVKNVADSIETFTFGNIKLDFIRLQAFVGNIEISLSPKEFEILEYMIRNEGSAVHRHDLLNEVWGYEAMPTTRTVDNSILDLRKKLEENPSKPKYFLSVRGVGYRFISLNQ